MSGPDPMHICVCRFSKKYPCFFPLHYAGTASLFWTYERARQMKRKQQRIMRKRGWAEEYIQKLKVVGVDWC